MERQCSEGVQVRGQGPVAACTHLCLVLGTRGGGFLTAAHLPRPTFILRCEKNKTGNE